MHRTVNPRHRLLKPAAAHLAALALVAGLAGPAAAEGTLRIAEQFGVGYLPLQMMRHHGLIEKHGREQGLDIQVEWARFAGGAAMNDALLSDNIDIGSGGVGPLLVIWDRTRGNMDVKGIAAINAMPLFLTTTNPDVETIEDFTERDKIALPAVKVSIQARVLQMAAEQAFGEGNHERLDDLTVSMPHPDATAAMLSGGADITAHLTSPPFQYQQLENDNIRLVLSSYDVLVQALEHRPRLRCRCTARRRTLAPAGIERDASSTNVMFIDSADSPGIQVVDLATFLHHRIASGRDTKAKVTAALAELWSRIADSVTVSDRAS